MSEIAASFESLSDGRVPAPAPPLVPERGLAPAQWGMLSFLVSEAAFFTTLIVVYRVYLKVGQDGPTSAVLSLPLVICTTLCLLASSVTIHRAVHSLQGGMHAAFIRWWALSALLGVIFLAGTAWEWRELVLEHGLTPSRNLFGSTYYTLVGFHAFHVTGGVVAMLIVLGLAIRRLLSVESRQGIELVSWYWHFVDVVWVIVFAVVYLARG